MKDLIIIGAGGFGREVKMLIDQINKAKKSFNILGFVDDNQELPPIINGIPLLGTLAKLKEGYKDIGIVFGIGDPKTKASLVKWLGHEYFSYPTLIHPNVCIGSDDVLIQRGCVICAGTIITCNIKIQEFTTINLCCTIGHDTIINAFCSMMPGVNVSGEVVIHEKAYIGTGAKIINQVEIGENVIIGAGAVVSKSLPPNCTAVGIPARAIKFH